VLLPAPVWPTRATVWPGLDREAEVVHGGPSAAVGERHMIELDLPADAAELHGVRLLQHGRRRVQHLEELGEPRRLEEQAVDEAHRLVETADQLAREAHEGDDLADAGPPMQVQPSAEREDRDQRDGRGRPRENGNQRPPVQDRELRRDQLVHQGAQLARLGREPDEALDHDHVTERIADLLGERRVVGLDRALGAVRAAEHGQGQDSDGGDEDDQQRAKAPVQEQRERQEHEKRHKGRKVLPQEREPDAEQGVGALPHDFELAA
jgi:hypothetical protein